MGMHWIHQSIKPKLMNYTCAFSNTNEKRSSGVCNIKGNYNDAKAQVHNILFDFNSCINVVKSNFIPSITIFIAPNFHLHVGLSVFFIFQLVTKSWQGVGLSSHKWNTVIKNKQNIVGETFW